MKKLFLMISLLVAGLTFLNAQDSIRVSGIVVSPSGKGLPDVSISIEGSSAIPVLTDVNGEFSFISPSGEENIMVLPIGGYKPKMIFLAGRSILKIYLTSEDLPSGFDQVSILSQQIDKRNIVSSFYSLDVSEIHHSPSLSLDSYMQGRVPGMNVINRSGDPGSGAVTTIRGTNSLFTGNQPFYIVDGIPMLPRSIFGSNTAGYEYNPVAEVNVLDISKVSVIKDPSITSAYGSRGSNGVIVIETLDPSSTETSIELDMRGGYSLAPDIHIPQLNASQHKTLVSEVLFSAQVDEEVIRLAFPNLYLTESDDRYIDYQHNTNWQKLIFDNSYFKNINIKVKGGDEIAKYGLSFGYFSSKGIIRNTGYDGYNLRFVSKLNVLTWLKMNAGVSLNYNMSSLKEAATSKETSPIMTSLAKSPLLNPYQYDVNDKELEVPSEVDELGVSNPVAIIDNFEAKNSNYNFSATLGFEGNINKSLNLISNYSISYNVLKEHIYKPNHGMERYYDMEAINVPILTNNDIVTFYTNTFLQYKKIFAKKHNLILNTGLRIHTNDYEYDWILSKNSHENDQYRMPQDGQFNLSEMGGANRIWNWISFYEYLNYTFKDKYILTASLSLDGSSRVGDSAINTYSMGGEPFGVFYSGGAAWRISNEGFLHDVAWLEELKIRFSMGKMGNDDIGESSANNFYNAVKFRETVGLYPAVLPNDKLSYETVMQMNTGIDLSLFGNRISLTADLFSSTTDNMLIYRPVESYFGYDFRTENGGKMENKGWEINSFIRLLNLNAFKWDINMNVTTVRNEVIEINGATNGDFQADRDQLATDITGAQLINREGSPANSFYGYVYNGVFSTQDQATEAGLVNNKGIPFQAGDAIYEDFSGPDGNPDGIINEYDKTAIGNPTPEYFGGFYNAFTYKRIKLSAFVQFAYNFEVFNYVRYRNERMTGLENQSRTVLNRWQYDGQETDVPRAVYNDPAGNAAFSSRWIEDGSFVRLKNITLSYTVPDKYFAIRNAEIYFSVNNMFILTKYLGYDPEFAYSYSQMHQGVDYGQTPHPRQFIAGVRIGL